MYFRRGAVAAVVAAVLVLVAACDSNGDEPHFNPPSPAVTTVDPGSSPSVGRPVPTKPAEPQAFPVLTEQAGVPQYIQTMVIIHINAVANRQPHEVVPRTVSVSGSEPCVEYPSQPAQQVGDAAKGGEGKAPTMAPCMYNGKLAVLYAPAKIYRMWQKGGRRSVETLIYLVLRDYLMLTTQLLRQDYEAGIRSCAAGRLVGGLRDKGYLTFQYANDIEAPYGNSNTKQQIYTEARDTGQCEPRLLGQRVK